MRSDLPIWRPVLNQARVLFLFLLFLSSFNAIAQVTTSTISGRVTDATGEGLIGATVKAVHEPSGTVYGTATNESGRFFLPAVRVGGPFTVSITYTGFETQAQSGISTSLGTATNVNFSMKDASQTLEEVVVTGVRNDIFSSDRTGAAQTFDNKAIVAVPVIGARSIQAITKYNPNGNGRSFGGQDSRLNNFTIDGSVFNNGFGLGTDAQAGGRTNSTAISLDAIEELQVNVAPFDVRQSGFVGAGVNAITKSGTNEFKGTAYYNIRNNDTTYFNGTVAKGKRVSVNKFDESLVGATIGGPIIKNKLFFFLSGEMQRKAEPATAFVADGSSSIGTITRVKNQDLIDVSSLLRDKFGYETGAFENYNNETTSDKFLARLDYNLSNTNKVTLRYTHHNSAADVLISNSNSAGAGNRRGSLDAMSYQNSGYIIKDNTRSIVAELNSSFSDKFHNNFLIGYDLQNEDRAYNSPIFPTIDILEAGRTYISAGMDPFTPNNLLNYSTFHITNNLSVYANKHTFTVGANYEYYKSNNNFFPASNSVYVFNSLADFKTAVNNPGDTSFALNSFQYRYSALEGGADPLQVLKVHKTDLYGQDEYQVLDKLKLTFGLRASLIAFAQTGIENPTITAQNFQDEYGNNNYKINTSQLPDPKLLLEPRFGFNFDARGDKKTQLRGGTGIFTGRPPYVFVSNQIGNNGVLSGFISAPNTKKYPFNPNPNAYLPSEPTLPSTFDIAGTDASYKFPQVWKSNLAIDQKVGKWLVFGVELLLNQNINAVKYFDANLRPDTARFNGPDSRPRFPGSGVTNANLAAATRLNTNVSRAAIMTNTDAGFYRAVTFKLEHPRHRGFYAMAAYTRSETKDLMSAGSIASGSWTSARSVRGNNDLDLAFADQDIPHRVIGLLNYRLNYGKKLGGATEISLGYVGSKSGRVSYTYAGDMNGDGVTNNDLLFVPNKGSDLVWQNLTVINGSDTTIYNATQQADAFDAFINQDPYLSTRRGKYAERNGLIFPWLNQLDFGIMQEIGLMVGGKRNALQVRFDILNFGNLLNSDWGVGNIITSALPLTYRTVSADGTPAYRLATQRDDTGKTVPIFRTFNTRNALDDVWQAQLSVRYLFNQ
jgi:hypothetical protein